MRLISLDAREGRVAVSNWPRLAAWSDTGMSIVLSLGVLTFLATVTLWARAWHPLGLFQMEAVVCVVGLGIAIVRRRRGVRLDVNSSIWGQWFFPVS